MSLHLTITSPEAQLRSAPVQKVIIPTEIGEIAVLPLHQPLISVVKSGMIKILPDVMPDQGYMVVDGLVHISVANGLLLVTKHDVIITTAVGVSSTKESAQVLEQMRMDMLAKIAQIKTEGNQDDLEEAWVNMEKITADLRIAKMGDVR